FDPGGVEEDGLARPRSLEGGNLPALLHLRHDFVPIDRVEHGLRIVDVVCSFVSLHGVELHGRGEPGLSQGVYFQVFRLQLWIFHTFFSPIFPFASSMVSVATARHFAALASSRVSTSALRSPASSA